MRRWALIMALLSGGAAHAEAVPDLAALVPLLCRGTPTQTAAALECAPRGYPGKPEPGCRVRFTRGQGGLAGVSGRFIAGGAPALALPYEGCEPRAFGSGGMAVVPLDKPKPGPVRWLPGLSGQCQRWQPPTVEHERLLCLGSFTGQGTTHTWLSAHDLTLRGETVVEGRRLLEATDTSGAGSNQVPCPGDAFPVLIGIDRLVRVDQPRARAMVQVTWVTPADQQAACQIGWTGDALDVEFQREPAPGHAFVQPERITTATVWVDLLAGRLSLRP